jgi:hypothetical protein
MADLPLTGGCMCGGVRWELSAVPQHSGYCHCTRCQRRTGTAAAVSARIVPGSLTVTAGEELIQKWDPPQGFSKAFCSACGSALWAQSQEDPDVVAVRMGSFDDDPGVRPSYHQFTDYAAVWEALPDDGLPRHPEHRPR